MFYTIRYSIIAFFIIAYILLVIKGIHHKKKTGVNTKITTKEYVLFFCGILGIVVLYIASFYPFEQSFITFKTEKEAFDYIRIDCTDFERFEKDDTIFYVDRDLYKDKLYSIIKKGDKFGYVNYSTIEDEYSPYIAGDIDCFDNSIPPNIIKKITRHTKVGFDVDMIYNEATDVTFYSVMLNNLENPDNLTATLNDVPLTFCSINDRPYFNSTYKAYCYYCFLDGEPPKTISIKAEDACCIYKTHTFGEVIGLYE